MARFDFTQGTNPGLNTDIQFRVYNGDTYTTCQRIDASNIVGTQWFTCEVRGDKVAVYSESEINVANILWYHLPNWEHFKNDRNIRVVGNPGKLTFMETKGTSCKCHSGTELIPDDGAMLYTAPAGETVPTWDKSLFYRNEKNPFVCNTESYSNYIVDGESCTCDSDNIALRELPPYNAKSKVLAHSNIPGATFEEKLQNCAKNC